MKRITMFVCFSLFLWNASAQDSFRKKGIEILPNSELSISGDTNINQFECEFNTSAIKEQPVISFNGKNSEILFKNAVLRLDNKGFDCGNKKINKDFHALLNTEEYPEITLKLNRINIQNNEKAIASVNIRIAGITKNYKVPVEVMEGEIPCFSGKLKLNITDFKLQPPKKVFGLIVIKEDIEIIFNLNVQT